MHDWKISYVSFNQSISKLNEDLFGTNLKRYMVSQEISSKRCYDGARGVQWRIYTEKNWLHTPSYVPRFLSFQTFVEKFWPNISIYSSVSDTGFLRGRAKPRKNEKIWFRGGACPLLPTRSATERYLLEGRNLPWIRQCTREKVCSPRDRVWRSLQDCASLPPYPQIQWYFCSLLDQFLSNQCDPLWFHL